MWKKLWHGVRGNPFDRLLRRAAESQEKRFLLCWNRGLGDIALGLFAMVHRIRSTVPDAHITFITRSDLLDGFQLLEGVHAIAAPHWKRGVPFDLKTTMHTLHLDPALYDVIIEHPDPTKWVKWQLGTLTPKLRWNAEWDKRASRFGLSGKKAIGVHVQTETRYGYEKNWPDSYWQELFNRLADEGYYPIILFGFKKEPLFERADILDLRGETHLFDLLSLIKNSCKAIVVPDSGVLSLTYYLDASFPLRIVSLWADPRQGVLKQNVASPNPLLSHVPLIGKEGDVSQIRAEEVLCALKS